MSQPSTDPPITPPEFTLAAELLEAAATSLVAAEKVFQAAGLEAARFLLNDAASYSDLAEDMRYPLGRSAHHAAEIAAGLGDGAPFQEPTGTNPAGNNTHPAYGNQLPSTQDKPEQDTPK